MTIYTTTKGLTLAELRDWINKIEFIEIKLIQIENNKYFVFYKKEL